MIFKSFEWDEANIDHIAEHHVSIREAEEACLNKPRIFKTRLGRYYVLGTTDSGRYMTVIITVKPKNLVRVVTARDMTHEERTKYRRS